MSTLPGDPAATRKRPVLDLPLSRLEIALRMLVVLGVGVGALQLALAWPALPASVPVHFELAGHPNRFGSKSLLLIPPLTAAALSLLLAFVARFPQSFNYPVRVTPENAPRLYRQGWLLLGWLNVLLVWLFAAIEQQILVVALGHAQSFSPWFAAGVLAVAIGVPLGILVLAIMWARRG